MGKLNQLGPESIKMTFPDTLKVEELKKELLTDKSSIVDLRNRESYVALFIKGTLNIQILDLFAIHMQDGQSHGGKILYF